MTELRDRFRDIDSLEVPDVLARARALGPKPPVEHPSPRGRRIATAALALSISAAALVFVSNVFEPVIDPAPATPEPAPEPVSCRWSRTEIEMPRDPIRHGIDVAGSSFDDLWVGGSKNTGESTLLMHYDGAAWQQVDLPGGVSWFSDIAAPGPDDLWLLGSGAVFRFDGSSWTRADLPAGADPSGGILEVVSPDDAWVTTLAADSGAPAILHWNGAEWSWSYRAQGNSAPVPSELVAVSAWGPDDVWAAGSTGKEPVALHWDGTSWTTVPFGDLKVSPARMTPFGLAAVGPDEALMTVQQGVLVWNGTRWVDTGLDAKDTYSLPTRMVGGASAAWATIWLDHIAHWDGETWDLEPIGAGRAAYGMTLVEGSAVFVGDHYATTPRQGYLVRVDC